MLWEAPPLHKSSSVVIAWTGLLGIHKFIVFTQAKNRGCIKPNIVAGGGEECNCKEADS